ncbi:MAG: hypothetical protein HQL32_17570 [Planctomycetes bacterium]|nr:hypothetical protein [Planctomycetota bacterium]
MKKDEVPQDQNPMLDGARKAVYAVNDEGQYEIVPTNGWQVEETVTSLFVNQYEQLKNEAYHKATQGLSSALEYHMHAKRMDIQLLAQCSGFFQFQVRRHLKPEVFKKLSNKKLQRYANAMGMDLPALQTIPFQES